jgi:signal transduction histidine kinase
VAQVVHDYGDICQAITQAAVEKKADITAQGFETLNLCLDNAIAGAVTAFNVRREDTLSDGESERLGYLTHELRNHLSTAMLAFAAVKGGRVAAGGSTGSIVDRSLNGMRDLLDTAISEVRLSAGTNELKRISVSRFLNEVEGAAALQAAQREMDLTFAAPPPDVMIKVDPQLLASALFNLLQNAFKYSIKHPHVDGAYALRRRAPPHRGRDECGGLPNDNAETFFSPSGPRCGKDRSGLGLGLSISRRAVKSFGGDIHVENSS